MINIRSISPKKNKYSAKPVNQYGMPFNPNEIDTIRFASKREWRRWLDLKLLEKAGEIRNLELQPIFELTINGILICEYIGDFRYFEKGEIVTEDAKGCKTPLYKLKKKLMFALHNIEIKET